MECVAYLMGEPHTDAPACACPVITTFVNYLNDTLPPDRRAELLSRLLAIAGSKSSETVETQRFEALADYMLRKVLPACLEGAPGYEHFAGQLVALPPYRDDNWETPNEVMMEIRATFGRGPDTAKNNATANMRSMMAMHAAREIEYILPILGLHTYKIGVMASVISRAVPLVDAMEPLDIMLAIGDIKPVALTPERQVRIAELVSFTQAARAS